MTSCKPVRVVYYYQKPNKKKPTTLRTPKEAEDVCTENSIGLLRNEFNYLPVRLGTDSETVRFLD